MRPGPKPLPRNLRVVYGTRDHNERDRRKGQPANPIPEPAVSAPEPPEFLPEPVSEKFREMSRLLAAMRIMTRSDVDLLVLYCHSWIQWKNAQKIVDEKGPVLRSDRTGGHYENPFLHIANRAHVRCVKIMAELGLTPSSRNRVSQ